MRDEKKTVTSLDSSSFITHPSSLLFEIGTEELPSADVDTALNQLRERVPSLLKELSLEHGFR
jgi:glycyl-tRNA synthetase beta subunit